METERDQLQRNLDPMELRSDRVPSSIYSEDIPRLREAFVKVGSMALPIFLQQFFRYALFIANYAFISHYDDTNMLGGLGLALCIYVLFVFAVTTGFNNALEKITRKLIETHRQLDSGQYLFSGVIMSIVITIPLVFLLVFSEQFLVSIKQNESIAYEASRFLIGLSPGVFFIAQCSVLMSYLNAHNKYISGITGSVLTFGFSLVLDYVFYFKLDMGLLGGGFSASIAYGFQYFYLSACVIYHRNLREAIQDIQFNRAQLHYLTEYVQMGVPFLLIQFLYLLAVEAIMPIAGLISVNQIAAQAIIVCVYQGVFSIFYAFEQSCAYHVNLAMRQGRVPLARLYSRVSVMTLVAFTVFPAIVLMNLSNAIGSFFSSNDTVQKLAYNSVFIVSFVIMIEAMVFSFGGILRGLGEQEILIVGELTFILLISLPIGCLFAFALALNLEGFWIGYLIKTVLQVAFLWFIIWKRLNWLEIAKEMKEENQPSNRRPQSMRSQSQNQQQDRLQQQEEEKQEKPQPPTQPVLKGKEKSNISYGTIEKPFDSIHEE